MNQDGLQNFISKLGSEVDPNAYNTVVPSCPQDLYTWFANGGLSTKIASFWAAQMGTGLMVSVGARKDNKTAKRQVEALQDWLNREYERLNVNAIMIDAETQCNIDRAAPIAMALEQSLPVSAAIIPQSYERITTLIILDPNRTYPIYPLMGFKPVDHRYVPAYQLADGGYLRTIHRDRVLPLQGKRLLYSQPISDIFDAYWGRPLCEPRLIEATLKYDASLASLGISLHKKNFLALAIEGYDDGFSGSNESVEYFSHQVLTRLKLLQQSNNLLNVVAYDKEGELHTIERNLSGMADVHQQLKEDILAQCDGIPHAYLFGIPTKTGGLSAAAEEQERVNSRADALFAQRWEPILKHLNQVLMGSRSCPVPGYPLELIKVTRQPTYSPPYKEQAEARKLTLEGDALMIQNGAMVGSEMRLRQSGSEFEFNIPLADKLPDTQPTNGDLRL